MVVHVPKRHRGEHFDDLGMITRLLSKKPRQRSDLATAGATALVEVVGSSDCAGKDAVVCSRENKGAGVEEEGEERGEEEEEEFDWQVEQELPNEKEEV